MSRIRILPKPPSLSGEVEATSRAGGGCAAVRNMPGGNLRIPRAFGLRRTGRAWMPRRDRAGREAVRDTPERSLRTPEASGFRRTGGTWLPRRDRAGCEAVRDTPKRNLRAGCGYCGA